MRKHIAGSVEMNVNRLANLHHELERVHTLTTSIPVTDQCPDDWEWFTELQDAACDLALMIPARLRPVSPFYAV